MREKLFFKEKPLHLFFFPLLFIINHFFVITEAINENARPWQWTLNFIGAIIVCSGLTFGCYKIFSLFGNKVKSAILTTLLFLPFFFFQDIFLSYDQLLFLGLRTRWVLPISILGLAVFAFLIVRSGRSFVTLNQYFNSVSALLVAYVAIVLVLSFDDKKPKYLNFLPQPHSINCNNCPDVYFFLLDSYTSNKSLKEYFGFDNKWFVKALKEQSFSVADQAKSAEHLTQYSLAAYLNFNQIKRPSIYGAGIGDAIRFNAVTQSFKGAGYRINGYSIFQVDEQLPYYSLGSTFPVNFVNGIIQNSILKMLYELRVKVKIYDINNDILTEVIRKSCIKDDGSNFFYAHIFAPHPPFVMDENGDKINFFNQSRSLNNPSAYVAQLQGLNKKMVVAIEAIIKSSPNAIIVIAGDHGYRFLKDSFSTGEANTVFLAYRGPNQSDLDSLPFSNDIFKLVFWGLTRKD